VIRAGLRMSRALGEEGLQSRWYATGRRGVSSLGFRGYELSGSYEGFSDRPAHADARAISDDLIRAYMAGELDRVEIIYNAYVSPLTQRVTHERLLPLSQATIAGEDGDRSDDVVPGSEEKGRSPTPVDYEPEPEKILRRLVPDYIELSIYRALVESTAGFFGAQMTAMRSASENAGEIITDYTLEMNRARQAEITQEIMEVVAGAEGLS
jgi:F-type H+-transporting ATPase subunit gamma